MLAAYLEVDWAEGLQHLIQHDRHVRPGAAVC
jgi:hypothetical protein